MEKAAKAEKRIKDVCDRLGITSGGRQWLDVALDPFKDIVQRPIGYPDAITAPSVVQTIHDSITVLAPASATGGNWDANIFLDSVWKKTTMNITNVVAKTMFDRTAQGATTTRGGLNIRSAAAGTPLGPSTTSAQGIDYVLDVFDNDTSARIIAIGMEAHNTTADLYKQGGVITYRVMDEPAIYPVTCFSGMAVATNNQVINGVEVVDPPLTSDAAIDMPGSLQWDAAKGAYVVPRFSQETNPPVDLRPMALVSTDGVTTYFNTLALTGAVGNILNVNPNNNDVNATIPFGLAGMFFTGLSNQTSLVINLTYYVEQFPSVNSNLKRLATPSCVEDFAALELYTKISRHMPTGVEVNDNFLGAFISGISRVASFVAPYVPRIINAISGATEVASTIGQVLNNDRQLTLLKNEEKSIVPYRNDSLPQNRSRNEIVVHENRNGSQDVIVHRAPVNSTPTQRSTNRTRVRVKNTRNKDYNRLDKYIKAGESGNRYLS
jgi:hypothetical protein